MKNIRGKIVTSLLSLLVVFSLVQTPLHAEEVRIAISDFTVIGEVGKEITPQTISLTQKVDAYYWPIFEVGHNITSYISIWITNFPSGLSAVVTERNQKTLVVSVSGTPTQSLIGLASLEPHVIPNANCTFNIIPVVEYYDVKVNDGTTESARYKKDEIVTINANTPLPLRQFKEWKVISGGITLDNPNNNETTFKMPANAVEVTAIYEDLPILPTPSVPSLDQPIITTGATSTYQISSGKDMTFICSGQLKDLTGVYVDGKLIDENHYTLQHGNTVLILKASYLDTLLVGTYTLKLQYRGDVSADTTFIIASKPEIVQPETSKSPQTGDTSNTMLYFVFIVLSSYVFVFRRKKY